MTTRHIKGFHNPNTEQVLKQLHKYSIFVQKYFWLTCQLNYTQSSRRLRLVQGLHYLISHYGSFFQILTKLFLSTNSSSFLHKCVQMSGCPIRFHQPEYMTHVLTGGCGGIPLKGLGYFMWQNCQN